VKKIGIAFLSSFAVLLTACGGGSPSLGVSYTLPTVPTTAVAIDSGNAQSVAQDALASSAGAMNAGYGGPGGVATGSQTKKTVKLHLDEAIRIANKVIIDNLNAAPIPAGTTSSYSCSAIDPSYQGSVTYRVEGNDERIDYNNCGDPAVVLIDGSIAATNVSYTGNPPSTPYTLSVTYSYDLTFTYNSGAETIDMMGRFDVDINDTGSSLTIAISNGEMGITSGGESLVMTNINNTQSCSAYNSFTIACTGIVTVSNNYTVGGTLSGGTITVATTTPLQIDMSSGAQFPDTGQILVSGNNSKLRITINGDESSASPQITVDIDADNNDVYEAQLTLDWSAI
jgi:hypothetical protein